ncbi:MAG: hypothetical protein HFJ32_01155 [Clostridia bacterium]|nr:hypothetical protein [Clostridia bacterium]
MKKYDEIRKISHSHYVEIIEENNSVTIKINKPSENMQTDSANFESLALICKCIKPSIQVTIQFEEDKEWNGTLEQGKAKEHAYLRFLYRMIMFEKAFDWVKNAKENEKEISQFKKVFNEALRERKVTNNFPKAEASFNPNKGEEHRIENRLGRTEKGREYLKKKYQEKYPDNELLCVYTQLPNGLFHNSPNEKLDRGKIFMTRGDYDLWGIDKKGNLCIFELKKDKDNEALGILSELFFYSIFAQQIHCHKERIHKKQPVKNFRGYEKLYDAVQAGEIKNVNAIFLLGKGIHVVIGEWKKELTNLLNTNRLGIHYDFIYYDIDVINTISVDELME